MSPEVIPFARSTQGERSDSAQLDKAGQTILQLLNKAADVAEQNSGHAIDTAQKLAHQLRAAEDRISELEAEVAAYQERAERAASGSIASAPKLRIDFCGRVAISVVRHNG